MPFRSYLSLVGVIIFSFLMSGVSLAANQPIGSLSPSDPLTYCKVAGTVDPKPRAKAEQNVLSPALIQKIRAQFGFAANTPDEEIQNQAILRCAQGKLWVCVIGANLPCGKADTAKKVSAEVKHYCQEQPNSDFIPATLTGHDTAYEWRCTKGAPVIARKFKLDGQGYFLDYWKEIA